MKALLQRVSEARVDIDGETVGAVGQGLVILFCAEPDDKEADAEALARKIAKLRIFRDDAGKMNRSLLDTEGELLVVSQFTLYGDTRKGRRPSYIKAMHPNEAEPMIERFVDAARAKGVRVETGRFGAMMDVELLNDGPVTLLIDSQKTF